MRLDPAPMHLNCKPVTDAADRRPHGFTATNSHDVLELDAGALGPGLAAAGLELDPPPDDDALELLDAGAAATEPLVEGFAAGPEDGLEGCWLLLATEDGVLSSLTNPL